MSTPYTKVALRQDVENAAEKMNIAEDLEARFANGPLESESTGVSYHRMPPGLRSPFGHSHDEAEEVYIVISGSGTMMVGDEEVALGALDAVRVAPAAIRAFEAGPDGLEMVAVGPRHDGDGAMHPAWWGGPGTAEA